jgi:4'-phosphopantetheinyl transferase
MLTPGHIHVWRIALDHATVPPPTAGELARAARFRSPEGAARYLKSHAALRDILSRFTTAPLEFALHEHGKPHLPLSPELRFNLSHSHEMALVAVTLDREVGVDIEKLRPLPRFAALADRFFPPSEPRPTSEADFFRHWTRIEAMLKARGCGLYGASKDPEGEWTIEMIPAPAGFAAAVAGEGVGFTITLHDYGDEK